MRTPTAFIFGALAATLIAAAAFRGGGQPVDSTFTYQGQLRNAGRLVDGNVDVRFTLWDSDVGGTQIGNANTFTSYPLADGRFALGLNFGTGAFNGDQRWVQIEFRSPAGTGQYLTLNPRDKIMATPYALYALNGTASQWDYNPKSQALTAAANVAKVGIGTSAPTAALEVVSATAGDDAVKLPAGSVGAAEIGPGLLGASIAVQGSASITGSPNGGGWLQPIDRLIEVPRAGVLSVHGNWIGLLGDGVQILIDGQVVQSAQVAYISQSVSYGTASFALTVPIGAGTHRIQVRYAAYFPPCPGNCLDRTVSANMIALFTPTSL
jgi:hypothetical protein